MIELLQVSKIFNSGKANHHVAVNNVNLVIEQGKLTVLKGSSGSGKTTLLSLIGCMARPSSGRIVLEGMHQEIAVGQSSTLEVTSLPERFLTTIRRSTFGFIFQQFNLIKGISTLENIMLPAYPVGRDLVMVRERALELLDMLSIARHANAPVEWLSGGELQRVAIARALINDPVAIIADEPTAHLDSRLSSEFMEILGRLKEEGKTILIASHDPAVFESLLADTIVEMRDGQITGTFSR